MPFNTAIRTILEYHTTHAPANEDIWYGSWNSILAILFPAAEGYMLAPHRLRDDSKSSIPDSIIEVVKVSLCPLTLRPVLIAEIQDTQYWESGIPALQHQLNWYTDGAFSGALSGTAKSKVYWIETIGLHWRYGDKECEGQDAQPLIDWHHTTHDEASFDDLQTLRSLVVTALE